MTRREELQLCAVRIAKECIKLGMYPLANEVEQALIQAERDCWDRLIVHLDWLITHNAFSGPDDPRASATVATYRSLQEWSRKQKESL